MALLLAQTTKLHVELELEAIRVMKVAPEKPICESVYYALPKHTHVTVLCAAAVT